ncbi:MAG: ComF family protein [Thiotrichales bacterium]|nr:ComF family protein [Thiotrichales bacterium]
MHWLETWWIPPRSVLSQTPGAGLDLNAEELASLPVVQDVCPQCAEFSAGGHLCGRCLTQPPSYDQTQVAFYYQAPVDQLILALKYQRQLSNARLLSELYWQQCAAALQAADVQALVAVPTHPLRRRERGYNQADLLAQQLAKRLRVPLLSAAVVRQRATASQTRLSAPQRQQNLRNAFALMPTPFAELQRIALVDDVITTGATMQALASLIKQQTAVEFVAAWALAKTP